jgi:hypothetical protein
MKGFKMKLLLFYIALIVIAISSWLTHVIYCFQNKEYLMLMAGAIVAPLGMLHGIFLWF